MDLFVVKDAHTIDLGEFKYGRTNITALRIVDPSDMNVINAVHDWTQGELRYGRQFDITPETVRVSNEIKQLQQRVRVMW